MLNESVVLVGGRKIRIAVLDDHPVVVMGVGALLRARMDFDVRFNGTEVEPFLQCLSKEGCVVAVVDFYLPTQSAEGVALLKKLRARYPKLVIVVYSAGGPVDLEYSVYRAGASAFLSKGEHMSMLPEVILSSCQQPKAFFTVRNSVPTVTDPLRVEDSLTAGEIEVLRHIALGLSVQQISTKLLRSKKTVSTHKRRAMVKLSLADDLALALYLKEKFQL